MIPEDKSPNLLSMAFHRDFFLPFIITSLNRRKAGTTTHFADYFPFEYIVLFIIAMAGVMTGISSYLSNGSTVGGIVGLLASAGFAVLITFSVRSRTEKNVTWKRFMITTFMFFMLLGLTIGLFAGMAIWKSFIAKMILGTVGLAAGYLAGIMAGLYMQYLGWIGDLINLLLVPIMIGLIIVDIIFLMI